MHHPPTPRPAREPRRIRVRRQRAHDDTLLAWTRAGDPDAFAELYRRHRADALRYAESLCRRHRRPDLADDVLAEAVRKTLDAISRGLGPRHGFRPYLFTVVRSVTVNATTRSHPTAPIDETQQDHSVPGPDDDLTPSIAVDALTSLPARWQQLLWATAVAGADYGQLSTSFGISPAAVASMAMRAREALRVAFVRSHLPPTASPQCHEALDLVARRVVTELSRPQQSSLDRHTDGCPSCRDAQGYLHTEFAPSSRFAGAPVAELFRPSRTSHRSGEREIA